MMVKKEDCRVKNAREGKAIYVPGKSLEEMEAEEAERQTRLSCRLVDLTDAEWSMIDTAIPDVLELLNDVRNVFDDIAYMDGLDRPGVNSMLRLAGDHQRPEPGPCLSGLQSDLQHRLSGSAQPGGEDRHDRAQQRAGRKLWLAGTVSAAARMAGWRTRGAPVEGHGFTIVNRKFESTVSVSRDDFSDDRLGVFKPMFAEMGHAAALHPDEIVFNLLAQGTTKPCFDGQYFFDTDHPVLDPDGTITGADGFKYSTVSNFSTGDGPTWHLLDTSRAVRPIIWQEREKYEFQNVTRLDDERAFMTDNFLYGVRARVKAGFGLWQLAHASRQPLTPSNYAAIRAKMQTLTGDQGRPLGIRPNVLVVPPQLEEAAFHLLNTETKDGGGSNPWKGSAEIRVTPYLAA